jgi:hypothetical protein
MNLSLAQDKLELDTLQIPARQSRSLTCTLLLITALAAFEAFNYSTTIFALRNMLGGMTIEGIRWAAILALAFCFIDIAGIARLFIPANTASRTKNDHYLFSAWLLAAGSNTLLTWRGITLAIILQQARMGWVVESDVLINTIPVFMSLMIWLLRILIIGSLSHSGNRMFAVDPARSSTLFAGNPSHSMVYDPILPNYLKPLNQFNRSLPISQRPPCQREPMYQDIPIRYKPF